MIEKLIKKKKIFILLILTSFCTAIILIVKSKLPIVTSAGLQNSFSIKDSKEKSSFITKYPPFIFKINDTLQINVKEFYSEYQFGVFSYKNPILKINRNNCQVVIITKEDLDSLEIGIDWGVEHPFECTGSHALICRFDSPLPPDTIELTLKKRNETNDVIKSFKLSIPN